jgi:hypothetical protein
LRADLPVVVEVTFVADEDDGHLLICVVPDLLQPLADRLKRDSARYVVDEQHADRLPIVSVRDCSIPLLSSRVPDLRPDKDILYRDIMSGEFYSNRCMRLSFKLVLCISE